MKLQNIKNVFGSKVADIGNFYYYELNPFKDIICTV